MRIKHHEHTNEAMDRVVLRAVDGTTASAMQNGELGFIPDTGELVLGGWHGAPTSPTDAALIAETAARISADNAEAAARAAADTAIIASIPPAYSLPTASTVTLGGVKIDGATINISGGGVISAAVASVAGRTGAVVLSHTDITDFNTSASAAAPVQSVAGRTGAVTLAHTDITDWTASRPVQLLLADGSTTGLAANTSEQVLRSVNVTFTNVGDRIHVVARGTAANSTDSKVIRLRLGGLSGTVIASFTCNSSSTLNWFLEAWVFKTGSNTQAVAAVTSQATNTFVNQNSTPGVTDTSPISLALDGQNSTNSVANSLQVNFILVEFLPA
jgi:hypothetical protein